MQDGLKKSSTVESMIIVASEVESMIIVASEALW